MIHRTSLQGKQAFTLIELLLPAVPAQARPPSRVHTKYGDTTSTPFKSVEIKAGIYFHWKIIELATSGQTIPTFAFRFTTIAEWGIWGYGTILGAYTLWVMMRADVKAAFEREGRGGNPYFS